MALSVLREGAEARVDAGEFLGRSVVRKTRVPKEYRHPDLDAQVRNRRTHDEARLILNARRAGVPVPVLYDIDLHGATITMEHVDGPPLRDVLPDDDDATAARRLRELGHMVGRLHDAGLTHGDLTTSNVLVRDDQLVLIDFGLGQATQEDEPRGVDVHLVEEALESTEPRAAALFEAFLEGYQSAECAKAALVRLEAIRERGRYRNH